MRLKDAIPFLTQTISSEQWETGRWYGGVTYLSDVNKVVAFESLQKLSTESAESSLLMAAESKNADVARWALSRLAEAEKTAR